ncbi:hypothetical protein [Aliivibrio fischeri]|uniref:hypothetical protein n=1 Tax=Aliivibrio fischeri TaxID=668 RepID=UPI0007C44665|nr:hypothetical protein [Aliivibrio fischeri]
MANKKINCFVIMPISDQEGYDDDHFQLVYEDIISPAIEMAGMNPVRADETKGTNLIQLDILQKVIDSPIAICDMSSKNPNVFYELGMRQAFDKPTVLLKDDRTTAPFDINGLRYCQYKTDMKHRNVKDAIEQLSSTLKETYANKDNKSEVNSLVRLLDLAKPAELPNNNISPEEKESKLLSFKLDSVLDGIDSMRNKISIIEESLESKSPEIIDSNAAKNADLKRGLLAVREQLRSQRPLDNKNTQKL